MSRRIDVAVLRRRRAPNQHGQVYVLITVSLLVLLGMGALAVDVGNLWTARRLMQSAADAAAIAGAEQVAYGDASDVTSAAQSASAQNGFTNGSPRPGASSAVSVAVYSPPASGPYAVNPNAVQVVVSQDQPTYFMRVLGWQKVPVSTIATAVTISGGSCVYSLNPTAPSAIDVGGTASVSSACGIYDDSNNASSALTVSGGGTITAPLVGVVGGTNLNGGGSSPPSTGIAAFGDPLAWLAEPTGYDTCSGGFSTQNINTTQTLSQGTFCGGLKLNSHANVTFSPGLYVMNGGGLTITSGAVAYGNGVTFYLTGANNGNGNAGSYGGVNIQGASTVNFTSPCSGASTGIPGVLFFQDRSETNGAASSINGGSNSTFSGALYFPTTALSYNGSSGADMFTLLVANTLTFTGATTINNDYTSCLPSGSLIKDAALVQ